MRAIHISGYPAIHKTRFSELGYWHLPGSPSLWQCVDLTGDKPAQVGTQYATEKELLANLEAYATEYGCDNANPKPQLVLPASLSAVIVDAYDALKDIVNADHNGEPYTGKELQDFAIPATAALGLYLPDSHGDAEHIDGRRTLTPLAREYEGQAHYMSKAANSLVNMLNGLDYSAFSLGDAIRLTGSIHRLISSLETAEEIDLAERMERNGLCLACGRPDQGTHEPGCPMRHRETYPLRRPDGGVVSVTIPERE